MSFVLNNISSNNMIIKSTTSSLPTASSSSSSSLSTAAGSSTATTTMTTTSTLSSLPRLSNESDKVNNDIQVVASSSSSSSLSVAAATSTTSTTTLPKDQENINNKKTVASSSSLKANKSKSISSSPNSTPTIKESQRKSISSSDGIRRNRDVSISNTDGIAIKANLFSENNNRNEQIEKSPDIQLSKRTLHKINSNLPLDSESTIDTSKRIPEIKRNLNKNGISSLEQENTTVVVDISQISQAETMAESLMSLKSKLGTIQLPRSIPTKSNRIPVESPTISTANVVIVDQLKASKNDQIVQERLQEGKALNRKDVNGATMHTFSLWSNVKAPSTQTESNALLPTFQFHSQPQACATSGFNDSTNDETDMLLAPAKKSSKPRGPKAAIDLVQDYNAEDALCSRERSSSLSNLNDSNTSLIDISKYPLIRHNSIGPGSTPMPIPSADSVGGDSGGYDDDFDDEDDDLKNENEKSKANELRGEGINDFKMKAGIGSGLALALRNKVGHAKSLTQSTDSLPVLASNKSKERNSDPDITIERTGSEDNLDPECVAYETLSFDVEEDIDSLAYSVEEDEELCMMQTARYSSENGQKKKLGATYPRSNSANSTKKIIISGGKEAFQKKHNNPFAATSMSNPFIPIQADTNSFSLTEANLKDNQGTAAPVKKELSKADIQRSVDASSPLSELSHEEKEIEVKREKKNNDSRTRNIKTPENSPLQWKRGEAIGQGTFGTVYKGLNERTGELLAIKEICLVDGSESDVKELRKEISIMWDLDHENIVRYIGTAQSERYLYIIIEFISGGSIASMLSQFGAFQENLVRRFTHQILCGVEYLHAKGIIHRDIKGANVLVTESGVAKLADFGCSKQLVGMCTASFEESLRAIRGSVPWMAPEIIKQEGHGRSSDIWSVGATVIEMATGKPPWPEFKDNLAALFHVATSKDPPTPPSHLSKKCAKFITQCMAIDAKNRLSAKELLTNDAFMLSERDRQSNFESNTLNTTSSYSSVPTEFDSNSPVSPARSAYENSLALSMQS